ISWRLTASERLGKHSNRLNSRSETSREAKAVTSRTRPNLQSIRAPHVNADAAISRAAVHRQRQAGRLLTQNASGRSDCQASESRWRCGAFSTDPTEPPAYQKRLQRVRQQKARQVKQCRLQRQRERFQGCP